MTGKVLWFDDRTRAQAIRVSYDVRGEPGYATIPVTSGRFPPVATAARGGTYLWHQPARPAWAGGAGPDMVVLFSRGSLRRPYAVPAFGRTSRAEMGRRVP
ncbi:hypothetical protein [Amycolatopsis sp. cmx-8-4]|uniref:hypothetical protein n=1 Tax=Amycolatopsis sp. cmx-8-4 TaxID=2790947 RepID=UPI00397A93D6